MFWISPVKNYPVTKLASAPELLIDWQLDVYIVAGPWEEGTIHQPVRVRWLGRQFICRVCRPEWKPFPWWSITQEPGRIELDGSLLHSRDSSWRRGNTTTETVSSYIKQYGRHNTRPSSWLLSLFLITGFYFFFFIFLLRRRQRRRRLLLLFLDVIFLCRLGFFFYETWLSPVWPSN